MVETTTPTETADGQTQFGNARHLDPSDCIFVFKKTLSDYEEPPSDDEEVSALSQSHQRSQVFFFFFKRCVRKLLRTHVFRGGDRDTSTFRSRYSR